MQDVVGRYDLRALQRTARDWRLYMNETTYPLSTMPQRPESRDKTALVCFNLLAVVASTSEKGEQGTCVAEALHCAAFRLVGRFNGGQTNIERDGEDGDCNISRITGGAVCSTNSNLFIQ
jgi:hypothetical protein